MDAGSVYVSRGGVTEMMAGECDADEEALIRAAQLDIEAFGPLYRRHAPAVYRYLRGHADSDEEAADLTQQVFLKALRGIQGYHYRSTPFLAWLFRIARNAAVDSRRGRRRALQWDLVPESLRPPADLDTEEAVLRREAVERMRRLLADLNPEKRELLALRFMAGLTAREIGAVMGKSEGAVHKQLQRILRALKEEYYAE